MRQIGAKMKSPTEVNSKQVRLQKFIADCGITSRRKAEILIEEGRVKVNGEKIRTHGVKIHPTKDAVTIDDNPIDKSMINQLFPSPSH